MEPRKKFRLKTFLYYILLEPWTEKLTLPNFRTLNTILLCISLFYKWRIGILISIILLVVLQIIDEYKKGDYVYWYRNRKGYGNYKEIIKKAKEEKKMEETQDEIQ